MINPFVSQSLTSRAAEQQQICMLLEKDRDFVVTGVPGTGRRTLVCNAAKRAGVRYLEIDCLRCRSASQFIRLLADSVIDAFRGSDELAQIYQWSQDQPLMVNQVLSDRVRIVWPTAPSKEWSLFESILSLPQYLAEAQGYQVVVVFHNLVHIRGWDRHRKWETYLLQEIQHQNRVSYALVATVAEPWMSERSLPIIFLAPLRDHELKPWITDSMAAAGLEFDSEDRSLELFLEYARGHIKDAITLAQRIWLECHAVHRDDSPGIVQSYHVHSAMLSLVQDISVTFEALLLLLPPTQAKLLESLALDPTDRPQSNTYIKKHHLSRGGSLQGALSSLEQKGLIYGPQLGYQVALPLFAFWLRQRL